MADNRYSFNQSSPPYDTIEHGMFPEDDYPPEPTETDTNNIDTMQPSTNRANPAEDKDDCIINTLHLLIKDIFTTPEPPTETIIKHKIFTPKVIATLIILSSVFLGPELSAIILLVLHIRTVAVLGCFIVGVVVGLNSILLIDKLSLLPKYVTVDIGILITCIVSPITFFLLPFAFTLAINLIAFCQFLFLLLVLSGNVIRFDNQHVYVVTLTVLYFMSSVLFLPVYNHDFLHDFFQVIFVTVHGYILFLVGLPRINVPVVCITFVWFGIWFLPILRFISIFGAEYIVFIPIFLLFFAFFIGLFLPMRNITTNADNDQNVSIFKKWMMKFWEFHKTVLTIRSKKIDV